jgi:cell division protease FtsH
MVAANIGTAILLQHLNKMEPPRDTAVVTHPAGKLPPTGTPTAPVSTPGSAAAPPAAVAPATPSWDERPLTMSQVLWELVKSYGAVVILFGFGIAFTIIMLRKSQREQRQSGKQRIEPKMENLPETNKDEGIGGSRNNPLLAHNKSKATRFDPNGPNRKLFRDLAVEQHVMVTLLELKDNILDAALCKLYGSKPLQNLMLIGGPGTGKTAIVRALATESGLVAFFTAGSEFTESYVGVGAARVRDTFAQARAEYLLTMRPVIIFIDEVDAVAGERGRASNTEQEQALNQLLVEMDGGRDNTGIIVIVATNRPEMLDAAFKRSKRFDTRLVIDLPDRELRTRIFQIYLRNKPISNDIDYDFLARRCPGFSGADIEASCEKAAEIARRRHKEIARQLARAGGSQVGGSTVHMISVVGAGKKRLFGSKRVPVAVVHEPEIPLLTTITLKDVDEGISQVEMGDARENRKRSMTKHDQVQISVHEACHAAVIKAKKMSPIGKITNLPRGQALGFVQWAPDTESYLKKDTQILAEISVLLAGRIGQQLFLKTTDTGASNDFERAEDLARSMVTRYGMSRKIGVIGLAAHNAARNGRRISDKLAGDIDDEVSRILQECAQDTIEILKENKQRIARVVKVLIREETILGPDFDRLWEGESIVAVTKA